MSGTALEPWSRRAWLVVSASLLAAALALDVVPASIYRDARGSVEVIRGPAPPSIWVPGILRAVALAAVVTAAFAALVGLAGAPTRPRIVAAARQTLRHWSTIVIAALGAAFVVALNVNEPFYYSLVNEDALVEDATSLGLLGASLLFAVAARRHRADTRVRNFCIAFSVALCLAGLDEISWGQRIFDVETPEFFLKNNDQRETNIHNTFQQWSGVRTKHVVGLAFVLYGVVMPWLLHLGRLTPFRVARYVVFPPLFLSAAMMIGALFMIDLPTGNEEEVGEFLLGLCLCIFGGRMTLSRQDMIEPARRAPAVS